MTAPPDNASSAPASRDARSSEPDGSVELPPFESHGFLLHNLIIFTRLLRHLGISLSVTQVQDLVNALAQIDLGKKREVRDAARCILITRREDLALFEQAFDWFWQKRAYDDATRRAADAWRPEFAKPPRPPAAFLTTSVNPLGDDTPKPGKIISIQTYSDQELLSRKDFGSFSPGEVEEAKKVMRALHWRTGERATRRKERGGTEFFDVRATMRRNLRYGGENLELAWKKTRFKPRPLVVICDISGSMENYARFLLHFVHALRAHEEQAEVFVFSTRLTRITRPLRTRQVERALHDVADSVRDWSGGTRIGEAIKTFNFVWARRILRPGAVVLIISDGWDRGDPELLGREMARLRRSVHRIIWLNPLLASPEYEPLTLGLKAALPYVDDFLPAHNLTSLQDLARLLSELNSPGQVRPTS